MSLRFLQRFLGGIVGYHLLHTFLGFGRGILAPEQLSVVKDMIWIIGIAVLLRFGRNQLYGFFRDWRLPLLFFVALSIRSLVISLAQGIAWGSMLVGFKYDLYPLFVLLSALALGTLSMSDTSSRDIDRLKRLLPRILIYILVIGVVRQGAKILFPELFSWFGYGPVGDYALGSAPPVYYRTGPGGRPRLQGLFAGPNNFGFFLVGLSSLVTFWILRGTKARMSYLLCMLFFYCLVWTLSRGAWISSAIGAAAVVFFFFPRYKKRLRWGVGLAICGVVRLSIQKSGSTSGHMSALQDALTAFVREPRGYGLGMAGPSVHYDGIYLPENHYMQIVLDLGLPGLVMRCVILGSVLYTTWKKRRTLDEVTVLLGWGIIALSIEGIFLHVWEDSMVNYLLLGMFGYLLGRNVADLKQSVP